MLEEDSGIIGGEYDGCDLPEKYVILGDIDRIVFQEIQTIVSHASPDERFSQGFSEHKLVLDNQEKPLSEVIKDFDFQKFYNLIHRIQKELNQNESFENAPSSQAVLAIRGVMNSITEITEEDKIVCTSTCDEVQRVVLHAFEVPKNHRPRPHNTESDSPDINYHSLDHYYYVYIVKNLQKTDWLEPDNHMNHL
jgi:hypothetical protein